MDNEKYQGWHNWATWNVNLWLNNEESLYLKLRTIIKDRSNEDAATRLHDYVHDYFENATDNPWAKDLIRGCLSDVDWDEIVSKNRDEMT